MFVQIIEYILSYHITNWDILKSQAAQNCQISQNVLERFKNQISFLFVQNQIFFKDSVLKELDIVWAWCIKPGEGGGARPIP